MHYTKLLEDQHNLNDIALEICVRHMHKFGNSDHRKTFLVAYLSPPFIQVSGKKYNASLFCNEL
jgi:hypothetical protein